MKQTAQLLLLILLISLVIFTIDCTSPSPSSNKPVTVSLDKLSPELTKVNEGAIEQTGYTYYYDPRYVKIAYPNGDVPRERGACTDVVIRAFRKGGVDLQKELHEDMQEHFSEYPNVWGLKAPDPNIDHRRVPNLMKFFDRKAKSRPITTDPQDYRTGDVVVWKLDNDLVHTGIVVNYLSENSGNHLMVHNIGAGAHMEDVLFSWKIIGHYRYFN